MIGSAQRRICDAGVDSVAGLWGQSVWKLLPMIDSAQLWEEVSLQPVNAGGWWQSLIESEEDL